jgi:predicted HicB family RNase H-like nuclease
MPMKNSDLKSELLVTRVTPRVKDIIEHEARAEGMDVSEWIRNLIIQELKKREVLRVGLISPRGRT